MKRTLLAILSSAIFATPAFALVGGPFDNNTFFGNDIAGTYQGTITGKNISGIMLFGTTSNSQLAPGTDSMAGVYGNGGRALIFVEGNMVLSDVAAVADVAARRLTLAIEGSKRLQDNTVRYQYQTPTNATVLEAWRLETAIRLSGFLNGKFTRVFPSLEFNGKGTLTVEGPAYIDYTWASPMPVFATPEEYDVHFNGIRTGNSSPVVVGTLDEYYNNFYLDSTTVVPPPPTPTPTPNP